MIRLTVIEPRGAHLSETVKFALNSVGSSVKVKSVSSPDDVTESQDVVILSADCNSVTSGLPNCGIVVAPDNYAGLSGLAAASRCIITYGMSPRSTLTLSSIGGEHSTLALQREVCAVNGGIIDRQEMIIPSASSVYDTLAAGGAMLLLGVGVS